MVRGALLLLALLLAARAAPPPPPCPPCPTAAPPTACRLKPSNNNPDECNYVIDNETGELHIEGFSSGSELKVSCPENARNVTLNSEFLPQFPSPRRATLLVLDRCALPAGAYARALARLNIAVPTQLRITRVPVLNKTNIELKDYHFKDLGSLEKLEISNENPFTKLNGTKYVFKPLSNLIELKIQNVLSRPILNDLENLVSLETLNLEKCVIRDYDYFYKFCKLPALKYLKIKDRFLKFTNKSHIPCNMTAVELDTRLEFKPKRINTAFNLPTFPAATSMTLKTRIQKLEECSQLVNLSIENGDVRELPEEWVSQCGRLERLYLWHMTRLRALSASALRAPALTHLEISDTNLSHLAPDTFQYTRKLQVLKLVDSKLKILPSQVFWDLRELRELDLSNNQLQAGALQELLGLQLTSLSLQRNTFGDLCATGPSMLSKLSGLEYLSLGFTGATRICHEWSKDLRKLSRLNLENNHIRLQWTDLLYWKPQNKVDVQLFNNMVVLVNMTKTQYDDAKKYNHLIDHDKVTISLGTDNSLRCDCEIFWFAKAMNESLVPVKFATPLQCLAPRGRQIALSSFPPHLMVCSAPAGCPANCSCDWYPYNDTIVVDCSNRGLTAIPDVSAVELRTSTAGIELRVSNNSISSLPELSALVRVLDVRHNALTCAGGVRGAGEGRALCLAGNQLDCTCAPLTSHDKEKEICGDEEKVLRAKWHECERISGGWGGAGAGAAWGAGSAALALLAGVGAALALRRESRLRLKAFLLARGVCLRWVRPDDSADNCKYDAFLSYAHEDADTAQTLLAALEGGAAPLRLCVHHRDWRPGEWILKQIAESVAESRRTIILLSENFARSDWARAEFREAYAHALRSDAARLIVVVLGAAPPDGLDPDLHRYVQNHTYLRWDEPGFWDKLRLALPPGRPRKPNAPRTPHSKTQKSKHRRPRGNARQPSPAAPPANKSVPPVNKPAPTANNPAPPVNKPKTSENKSALAITPAARRPPPLTVPTFKPGTPQPPTPIIRFGQIDFSAPLKPAKTAPPPCT